MTQIAPTPLLLEEARQHEIGTATRDRILVGLAAGGVALPPLIDLLWNGWERVFGYFAADSFYYLTVARNIASGAGASFDGEYTTNGFHPLWQLYTAVLYAISSLTGLGESAYLVGVFLSSLLLIVLATALLGSSFRLALGRIPAAFPILPVGLYALSTGSLQPLYGSLWSFANGMESGVTLAAFAWVLRCMVQRERGGSLAIDLQLGAALSVMMLGRLDHAALAVCVLAAYALRPPRWRDSRWLELAAVAGPFGLTLGAYLCFNWLSAGSLLPVSGTAKSSFPQSGIANLFYLDRIIHQISATRFNELWRMVQMLLPALPAAFAVPWLAVLHWRERHDALTWPLALCSVFVLVLTAYNFLFVNVWHQGQWYYPVSIVQMTVLALYIWEKERPVTDGRRFALVAGASTAIVLLFFGLVFHDLRYNLTYSRMYSARDEIKEHFSGSPPRMIEYDDGIISFATGFPAMSGLGFAVDREAVPWAQSGRILWLAYERGFDHIVSLNYFGTGGLTLESSSDEIREKLNRTFFLSPDATDPFQFEVVYLPSRVKLAFIRIRPDPSRLR
ncbi:MAG: hypothetical protein JRD03_00170 [Deltaproteobacteria bacterium]|nr:hypothetical protein [Deltaproteobacteria bacterium]